MQAVQKNSEESFAPKRKNFELISIGLEHIEQFREILEPILKREFKYLPMRLSISSVMRVLVGKLLGSMKSKSQKFSKSQFKNMDFRNLNFSDIVSISSQIQSIFSNDTSTGYLL